MVAFTKPKYLKEIQVNAGEIVALMRGLIVRKNKNNGYVVARLHYSADPAKDNEEFKKQSIALSGTREKQAQEYEIDWDVVTSDRVWKEFERDYNIQEFNYDPALPLIETWDPGIWSCCLYSQFSTEGQLRILGCSMNMAKVKFPVHIPQARAFQKLKYPEPAEIIPIMDIASRKSEVMQESTAEDILTEHYGRMPISNSLSHRKEATIDLVGSKLIETVIVNGQQQKAIIVHPSALQVIDTFAKGYVYKDQIDPAAPKTVNINEVHPWEDIADCINYTVYHCFVNNETIKKKKQKQKAYDEMLEISQRFGV